MKFAYLVFPPLCYPISPYGSTIILNSVLNSNGYEANVIDLNAKIWNEKILNKKYLEKCYDYLSENIQNIKNNGFQKIENKFIKTRLASIEKFLSTNDENIKETIENVKDIKHNFQSAQMFYDINTFDKSATYVIFAQEIFLYSFFLSNYFHLIDLYIENSVINPYYDYFIEKINNGLFEDSETVMITHPFVIQTLACFTLGYLLKKYTNKKVVYGGNYISRCSDFIKKEPRIFQKYFDYVQIGLGDETILDLAGFIKGKKKPKDVPGLIYIENKKIKSNPPQTYLNDITKRPKFRFDGINFKDYLIPEVIIPMQVSKGCPWGKCTFCVFHEGKTKYQIVPVKQVVAELKYLYDNYNITKFEFVDEALPPKYFDELSKEILKQNLNIRYCAFARFDEGFTEDVLNTMYKSGFRMFKWGYEVPSERIMKIFNKGIKTEARIPLLKASDKANIWNDCLTISEIPFESEEEELEDSKIYFENIDAMHSREIFPLVFYKHSELTKKYKKLNITGLKDIGDLSQIYKYIGTENKLKKKNNKYDKLINKVYSKFYLRYEMTYKSFDEYLFLYICKYGKDNCLKISKG